MAKQKGIIKIEGTIGDITFFKTADGYLAREKSGVSADRIKTEAFASPGNPASGTVVTDEATVAEGSPAADPAAQSGAQATGMPTVMFARSGKCVALLPGKTILEAAEEAGVPIDFECRSGVCGTCKTRLTAGRVSMEVNDALTPRELSEGYVLACQAQAVVDVAVDA